MGLYVGIDLGTSSTKLMLVDETGKIINQVTREYPLMIPNPGWSEQEPGEWWSACVTGMKELLAGFNRKEVKGIGCAGQMHGLVILDKDDNVIRPAILWNDGRTYKEVDHLNNVIGRQLLSDCTANVAFAGFTAPKILWIKNNEPGNFERIARIMLPKDYINYKLTGIHCTDYSDASGMLLLDVKNRKWSSKMLELCDVKEEQMPKLFESYEVIGKILPEIAEEFGLSEETAVVAGAGDNAAAAVGTGTVRDGACNISLGTSGTVFISCDKFGVDPNNALHSFAHANGKYHLMGCMLSAASCNKWFCSDILKTGDFSGEQAGITDDMLGKNRVFFLPYLMGERSPINDTDARAVFLGMSMDTGRRDMVQSVAEGVAFAIRDSVEIARSLGIKIERSGICGGGGRSPLWRKIFADVLNICLDIPAAEEGPGYGGAMLAMVGCGEYASVEECASGMVRIAHTVEPDPEIARRYERQYRKFREIYPALKPVFRSFVQ